MIPHSIRLRHPWEQLPAEQANRASYRRRFNRPTGLDAWERVSLEIDRTMCCGEATLNGRSLGKLQRGELFAADITNLLQEANELTVAVDLLEGGELAAEADGTRSVPATNVPASHSVYIVEPDEPLGSPIGDVRLVIRTVHPAPSPPPSPKGRGS